MLVQISYTALGYLNVDISNNRKMKWRYEQWLKIRNRLLQSL